MSEKHTIAINGVHYDTLTGMPVSSNTPVTQTPSRAPSAHAKGVHHRQQRSATLSRQFAKKPATQPRPTTPVTRAGSMDVRRPNVKRSGAISKFAPHPVAAVHKPATHHHSADIGPVHHPIVQKAHAATAKVPAPVHKPAQQVKTSAISEAMAKTAPQSKAPRRKQRGRIMNVASASLAVLLLAGYFTYVNMPGLSVRIAAAQAGIDASYPEYHPVGYRLNGPVAYSDGEVSMRFVSNAGPQSFALSQSKSSWDSNTLLEKYVNPKSDGRYATYSDGGLTMYTYGSNAAWVNGGILYTVEGDALLSNQQVRRIATSL